MTNIFYTPTGNPATGSEGLSALIRAEFALIAAAFNSVPQFNTIGAYTSIFQQVGSYTYILPPQSGTLAEISDVTTAVATETTARIAADAVNAAAIAAETARALGVEATNANAIAVETARATAAEGTKQPTLGFTPVQQGTGIGQLSNVVKIGWSGAGLRITVDGSDQGLFVTTAIPQGFLLAATAATTYQPLSPTQPYVRNAWGTNQVYLGYYAGQLVAQVDSTYFGQVPTQSYPGNFTRNGDTVSFASVTASGGGTSALWASSGGNLKLTNASGVSMYMRENNASPWGVQFCNNAYTTVVASIDDTGNTSCAGNLSAQGAVYPGNVASGGGFFLLGGATYHIINLSTDGWKLSYTRSNGTLTYFNAAATALLNLDGSGNLTVTGNVTAANVSDERTKRDIQPFRRGLQAILGLQPIEYRYNGEGGTTDDGKRRWGVTAQQARMHLPEGVYATPEPANDPTRESGHAAKVRLDGQLSFDEQPLIYAMVNAFQDVVAELAAVKSRLAALEARHGGV